MFRGLRPDDTNVPLKEIPQFVSDAVSTVVKKEIEKVFHDEAFLMEAGRTENLSQGSHMTLFAKNSLNVLTGVDHLPDFDLYSEVLPDALVEQPLGDLATILL